MNPTRPILVTGGHMTPALAVISALRQRGFDHFVWVGHKRNQSGSKADSAEYNTIKQLGIKFVDLKAGKLARNWGGGEWLAGLTNLGKVPWGFIHACWIVIRHRPSIVLSFGGYIALPVAVMGKLLGRVVITHEQTAVTGLTNRIIPKFSDKVLISWPSSAKFYPADKTILVGNPLRLEIFGDDQIAKSQSTNPKPETKTENRKTIYITGGNQGSHKLNDSIFPILPDLLKVTDVIHQTGNYDAAAAEAAAAALPEELKSRYQHAPFFYADRIGEIFARASLIIARSGANTVYETLALGKPSIFVPIPWVTHNEQMLNARIAADTGLASIVTEAELSPERMLAEVKMRLGQIEQGKSNNPENNLEQAQREAKKIVVPDAADRIANIITQYLPA